jgi:hypothetical protein
MLRTCGRAAGLKILSGKHFTEELRGEVSAVPPGKRVVTHQELTEELHVLEGLKDGTVELVGQVHLAAGTIIKSEPHSVTFNVFGFDNMRNHGFTPVEK